MKYRKCFNIFQAFTKLYNQIEPREFKQQIPLLYSKALVNLKKYIIDRHITYNLDSKFLTHYPNIQE